MKRLTLAVIASVFALSMVAATAPANANENVYYNVGDNSIYWKDRNKPITINLGTQGPAGPMGPQGDQGVPGVDGRDGRDGADGTNGTNGTDGVDGTNGTNGVDGAQGEKGDTGPRGERGPGGRPGVDGTNGTDGVDGTNGTNGTNGVDGAQGEKGDTGAAGKDGDSAQFPQTAVNDALKRLEERYNNGLAATTALGGLEMRTPGEGDVTWSGGLGGIVNEGDSATAIGFGIRYGLTDDVSAYGKVSRSLRGDATAWFVGVEGQF